MTIFEIIAIGVALAMDAFAVSICKGLSMKKVNYKDSFIIALFFGGFQALMPLIGYYAGTLFLSYIEKYDHWVAFILLAYIGGKMIVDALHPEEIKTEEYKMDYKELTVMAIATSIDALAVGIAFSCEDVQIFSSIAIIGIVTFVICFAGVSIGNRFGAKYQNKAQIAGGIVLLIIGIRIIAEHLF